MEKPFTEGTTPDAHLSPSTSMPRWWWAAGAMCYARLCHLSAEHRYLGEDPLERKSGWEGWGKETCEQTRCLIPASDDTITGASFKASKNPHLTVSVTVSSFHLCWSRVVIEGGVGEINWVRWGLTSNARWLMVQQDCIVWFTFPLNVSGGCFE